MLEQITVDQLAEKLDSESEEFALIDTRPEDSYKAWRIPGAANVPFGPVETLSDEQQTRIDTIRDSRPIVTICGMGVTSATLAAELDANGYDDVTVVKGGMRDWNARYEEAVIDVPNDDCLLIQFQRRAKGCLSYLIGSQRTGEAVVVDPTRHTDQYIVAAAEAGLTITRVLDTHIHADHISGGKRLADRLDVPYHLGAPADRMEHEFQPLADGETLHLGDIEITALYAPGHTSEMMVYRIDGTLLTGDALFVDSVGRTELEFGDEGAERGARLEYETLHETLFDQPDDLIVLPGHVTVTDEGTFENGSPGEPVRKTLADIREQVDVLSLDEDAFVDQLISDREKPANYETIIELNRGVRSPEDEDDITGLETGANNCAA